MAAKALRGGALPNQQTQHLGGRTRPPSAVGTSCAEYQIGARICGVVQIRAHRKEDKNRSATPITAMQYHQSRSDLNFSKDSLIVRLSFPHQIIPSRPAILVL